VEKRQIVWLHLSKRWKKGKLFGSTFQKGGKKARLFGSTFSKGGKRSSTFSYIMPFTMKDLTAFFSGVI